MMRVRAAVPATTGLLGVVLVVVALGAPQAHAQRLGRLFTTPEQRSLLDEVRTQAQFTEPELEPEPEPQTSGVTVTEQQPAGPSISKLTINGVVRRRGGRTTVWVNGYEIDRGDVTREGVLVESAGHGGGDVRLRLPSGTETIALRPGQKIDVGTGTVLEPYEQTPSSSTQGAFSDDRERDPLPSPTPAPPASPSSQAGEVPATDPPRVGPVPVSAEVLERLEALTKAARAAVGIGTAPASP